MNTKTLIAFVLILGAITIVAIISYTGYGLPSQNDPLTIRQLSAQNERQMRGGGPGYGK